MAPRASAIEEQDLSEAVAARVEAPRGDQSDQSMRQVGHFYKVMYHSSGGLWGTPPVKSVADSLMYLFQDRKLQPSTIDGYRSAIAVSFIR